MQVAYAAGAARQEATEVGNSAVASLSSSDLGAIAEKLINTQFSQPHESEADDYSFNLLTAAKLKREGLITAFEKARQARRQQQHAELAPVVHQPRPAHPRPDCSEEVSTKNPFSTQPRWHAARQR